MFQNKSTFDFVLQDSYQYQTIEKYHLIHELPLPLSFAVGLYNDVRGL